MHVSGVGGFHRRNIESFPDRILACTNFFGTTAVTGYEYPSDTQSSHDRRADGCQSAGRITRRERRERKENLLEFVSRGVRGVRRARLLASFAGRTTREAEVLALCAMCSLCWDFHAAGVLVRLPIKSHAESAENAKPTCWSLSHAESRSLSAQKVCSPSLGPWRRLRVSAPLCLCVEDDARETLDGAGGVGSLVTMSIGGQYYHVV